MRVIDDGCKLPDDERESYSRYVNFRPADGAVVHLNPPRFSWPYLPDTVPESTRVPEQIFTFQISSTQDFSDVHMEVKDVPYNFYNALPALGSPSARRKWYWRVGYNVGMKDKRWSSIRSFTIDEDAIVWDRSVLADPDLASIGHPRILFNSNTLKEIRLLKDSHPESKVIAEGVRKRADEVMSSSWWKKFPEKDDVDPKELGRDYFHMAHDMLVVAFAYILFEDPKYLECKERFLRMASWEKGGYASPEAAGGRTEDATQTNEFLALFFDWFYNDLSDEERQIMINSLEWRIDHIVNEFSWRRREDGTHHPHSVSLICFSHGFEALMDTLPTCLAAYEHSQIARDAFHLGVNYLMGITNGFGFEEGWNEGSGYGNSKMGWLMNATIYFDTAIPGIDFSKNPFYRTIGDFFCRIAPVGLQHTSFGNGGFRQSRIHSNRARNFRELAYLTGDGRFLTNRKQTFKMQGRENRPYYGRLWIEYVLPYYYEQPQESLVPAYAGISGTKLFKIAGWVTVDSKLPSLYDDYKDAVGMIFHCRPRGGYSHSFFNENAFDIFAYGQVITHGGGTTNNQDKYADQTMSHNSVLIDGVGQYQFRYWPLSQVGGTYHRVPQDRVGYIAAFDETDDYVYWVGDATNAYETIPYLKRYRRHVLFVKDKYFVIFDDLATDPDHEPSRFYWLYHIYPDASVGERFTPSRLDKAEFKYQIGETHVKVKHIANSDDLICEDKRGLDGLINPTTDEDYREFGKGEVLFQHNIWVSNSTPANEFQFLAVVFPYRDGDPEPMITALDNMTVRIQYGSEIDTISYDPRSPHQPDIVVDYKALR